MTKQERLTLIRAICARPVKSVADKNLSSFREENTESTPAPAPEGFTVSDAIWENQIEKSETSSDFAIGELVSPEMAKVEGLSIARRDVASRSDYSGLDSVLASF